MPAIFFPNEALTADGGGKRRLKVLIDRPSHPLPSAAVRFREKAEGLLRTAEPPSTPGS
ncbi:hypothetical protein [Candidatus Amarobacter glycogenicus]|uniref:hypothetical protein n=1 Tax=Candidatus Amarobacter glycogenicus TaxID=3140699 RepID=UPI0031374589|nr:hypothetical protein [Dehalococcoidia bacterium]